MSAQENITSIVHVHFKFQLRTFIYVTQARKRNGKNYIILCLYLSHLGSRIIVHAKPHQPEKLSIALIEPQKYFARMLVNAECVNEQGD